MEKLLSDKVMEELNRWKLPDKNTVNDDREMTENEWAMQQHITTLTAERNHYQSALEGIANLMNKPTAGLSNACAIARAALDGEG